MRYYLILNSKVVAVVPETASDSIIAQCHQVMNSTGAANVLRISGIEFDRVMGVAL